MLKCGDIIEFVLKVLQDLWVIDTSEYQRPRTKSC